MITAELREGGQGSLREGSQGEGGTRTAAACGSKARGLPGRGDLGPKTPIRSLGEASSFTVQMRSFQGHVCTGPAGVRVRECVRVRVCAGGGEALLLYGATPGAPIHAAAGPGPAAPIPAFSGPRATGPGFSFAPAPPPHCGGAAATATAARAPTARGGGREEPGATFPLHAARPSAGRCAPQVALSPPSSPLPDPLAPRTPSHRWPKEDRRAAFPGPAPRSPLGPPPGASRVPRPAGPWRAGSRGEGRGAGSCQAAIFCRRRGACAGPGPRPPPPIPAGRGGSRLFRVRVSALLRAGRRPQAGLPGGGRAGRRGRPAPSPCSSAEPGTAAEARGGGGPPRHCIDLNLSPEPGGGGEGALRWSGRDGRGRLPSPRGHKQTLKCPVPPWPAVSARSPVSASARRRVAGVPERALSRALPAAVPPARPPLLPGRLRAGRPGRQ